MSEFIPGLVTRCDQVGAALKRAFDAPDGFAARDIAPQSRPSGPRHFAPVSPGHRATDGWDLFNAARGGTDTGDAGGAMSPMVEPEVAFALNTGIDADAEPAVDPIAVACDAAFARGVEAGRAQAQAQVDEAAAAQADLLRQLGAAMADAGQIDRAQLADDLRQTVVRIVTQLIGETAVPADVLTARVQAAADTLADSSEAAVIRLNPDDLALVTPYLPEKFTAISEPARTQGSFMIESASTLIEDGPDQWLDQLAQTIDRVPLPVDPVARVPAHDAV